MIEYNHYELTTLKRISKGKVVLEVNPFLGELTVHLKEVAKDIAISDKFKYEPWMEPHVPGDYQKEFEARVGPYKFFDVHRHAKVLAEQPAQVFILNRVRSETDMCAFFDTIIKHMPIGGYVYMKEFRRSIPALFYQKVLFFKYRNALRVVENIIDGGTLFQVVGKFDESSSMSTLWVDTTPPEIINAYYSSDPTPTSKNAMRVAFLTPGFNLGGAERWILALCKNFSSNVVVTDIVIEAADHVNVEMLGRLPRQTQIHYGNDKIHAAMDNCDVCIAWGAPNMVEIAATHKKPTVMVAHGAPTENNYTLNVLKAAAKAGIKHYACVSTACLPLFPNGAKPRLIWNGAEMDRVVPAMSYKQAADALEIKPHQQVLLYIGRIMPDKQVNLLPKVASELGPDVAVRLVGNMAYFEDSELGRWHKLARYGDFKILPPVYQVGDYLQVADACILLSRSEAHPMALTEAWMAGVPTVTSDIQWIQSLEALQERPLSWLVDVEASPRAIADQVRAAMDSVYSASYSRVETAKNFAFSYLNAARMASEWESYLLPIARGVNRA